MENHLKQQYVAHNMANDTVQPADPQYQATYQVIGGKSHGMGRKTVSYTHLTLPTKRIV